MEFLFLSILVLFCSFYSIPFLFFHLTIVIYLFRASPELLIFFLFLKGILFIYLVFNILNVYIFYCFRSVLVLHCARHSLLIFLKIVLFSLFLIFKLFPYFIIRSCFLYCFIIFSHASQVLLINYFISFLLAFEVLFLLASETTPWD